MTARVGHHSRRGRGGDRTLERLRDLLREVSGTSGRKAARSARWEHLSERSRTHGRPRRRQSAPAGTVEITRRTCWVAGISTVLLLVLAGWIVAGTMTDQEAAMPKGVPLASSGRAALLDADAQQLLAVDGPDADLDGVARLARQALATDPLDSRALALLGLSAYRQDDMDRAETLLRIAGQRTWRDPTVQIWLFGREVEGGQYRDALTHADALLRTYPSLQPRSLGALADMTLEDDSFDALATLLGTNPPWRQWLLGAFSARLANTDRLIELYGRLRTANNPPTVDELRPFLDRLIAEGRYGDAYQGWLTLSPAASWHARDARPYDGDFSTDPSGLPFDWILTSTQGARVDIVDLHDGDVGRALRIQFSGARVQFHNVRQLMLLKPGGYRLTGWYKSAGLDSARGLWWRLTCAGEEGATLGQTGLVSGTAPWSGFDLEFEVPDTGCEAQWLVLELPARIAAERRIEGQVWYRALRIVPTASEGGQTPAEE